MPSPARLLARASWPHPGRAPEPGSNGHQHDELERFKALAEGEGTRMTTLSQPGRVMPSCGWAAMCGSSGLRWKAGSRDAGDLGGRLRFEPIECGREMLVVGRCRFERRQ